MEYIVGMLIKIALVLGSVLLAIAYLTLLERKIVADIQVRWGPTRVGPYGLLQPIADGIKLFFKEDIVPKDADRAIYTLAPVLAFVPALLSFAVIPFGPRLYITDINIGLLYLLAISSLGVYGIVLAGWSSNNKYSLLGGLRSAAQMLSYELSLSLSVIGVLMHAGSLSLVDIVNAQTGAMGLFGILPVPRWFIFTQPLGFLIFLICGVAETNRAPFDLPEAESELVAGFHVEYSSMKFAMFFMAEYANMVTISALATTLFLGGWMGPFLPPVIWFLIKVFVFLFLYIWLRATLPRLRYDRLMRFGWKVLLPTALANVLITGAVMVWRW